MSSSRNEDFKPVTSYVHWQDLARLDVLCEEEDRSRAWVLRKALGEYLERHYGDVQEVIHAGVAGPPRGSKNKQ